MKIRQIVFTEKNKAELLTKEADLKENQVCVQTMISTISPGTERANITGDLNVDASRPAMDEAKFPRTAGYSSAGVVTEVGKAVTGFEVGDRVVVYWGKHKDYNMVPEENVVKIEDERVSFEEAAISFIATFPLAAIRKTRLEVGESMMVMGLGLLGQLAVQLARAAGAVPIIAVDPVKERREEALKNGADYALDPFDADFVQTVKELTDGGVKTAIEVTGSGAGLEESLDCMAKFGRIALLGCTRDRNFTIDYYRKVHFPGITIVGAHTNARPMQESYPGYFTHRDDIKTVLKLCASQRIDLKRMTGEFYSPEECQEVFDRLINDRNFPIVVQFDWRQL
ncbi:MAG: zinc-binding dehydrogenase [Lachnospiraceae bacterium]|nr:zinc-binding dehydrogenase [Lachnospiraceae bacterium]